MIYCNRLRERIMWVGFFFSSSAVGFDHFQYHHVEVNKQQATHNKQNTD